MRRYAFNNAPECDSVEEAIHEWQSQPGFDGTLPAVIFWTDYDASSQKVGEGSFNTNGSGGEVTYWRDSIAAPF